MTIVYRSTVLFLLAVLVGCGGQQFTRRETDPEKMEVTSRAKLVVGSQARFKDCFLDEVRARKYGHVTEQSRTTELRIDVFLNNVDLVLTYSMDIFPDGTVILLTTPWGRFGQRMGRREVEDAFAACVTQHRASH